MLLCISKTDKIDLDKVNGRKFGDHLDDIKVFDPSKAGRGPDFWMVGVPKSEEAQKDRKDSQQGGTSSGGFGVSGSALKNVSGDVQGPSPTIRS